MRYAFPALSAMLVLIATTAAARAADSKGATTDPKEAGPDYVVQGEYEGELTAEGETLKVGVQVIALGEGKFEAVAYHGGLPGAGWKRGDKTHKVKGETKDGVTTFKDDGGSGFLKDGVITIADANGKELGTVKKTERKSPTLGAKPPQGAVVLFDGSSADNFINGKLIEGNLLAASNCESKQKFGDHTLHIEFRTPYMAAARGQGRGNSGVYIQSRWECQVLDSFGLEGENNECGGIYSIAKPLVNMCLPPLAWQTYDISFTAAKYEDGKKVKNARATIIHNGVVIHDDLELTKGTPGKAGEGPEPLGVFLQDHGNPVAFRNIWVVEKK
jgi:hypothetical protein